MEITYDVHIVKLISFFHCCTDRPTFAVGLLVYCCIKEDSYRDLLFNQKNKA